MAKIVKTQIEIEGKWHEEEVLVEQEDLAPWTREKDLALVGKAVQRVDGEERTSGTAMFTYDVQLPGMLIGKILRSPLPHAKIIGIDTSEAEALPGVRGIVTRDSAAMNPWLGSRYLFEEIVRFEGDEIAAVAADNEDIARDALKKISVQYEPLPFVLDPDEALKNDAPMLREGGNEAGEPAVHERGDLELGFTSADVVVKQTYKTPAALHNSLETHGSVVKWEGKRLIVWDSTQHIFGVRSGLAEALELPLNDIRVIKQYIGGGFGSKTDAGKYTIIAALLAKKTNRPIKIMLDRREENLAAGNRPPASIDVRLGAKKDGTLTAIQLVGRAGIGAYGIGAPPIGGPARELYACENVKTVEQGVYINTGPASAFRAPGYVEGSFALESALDELALELDMDPLELRKRNYADKQQVRNLPYSSKDLTKAYEMGARKIALAKKSWQSGGSGNKKRGIGMASQIWGGGGSPPSYAVLRMNADATFDLITGTQDIGTGTKTVMLQIASEELGVSMSRMNILIGDTLACPYAIISAGSLSLPSVGPAVRAAAKQVKMQLLDIASSLIDVPIDDLDLKNETVISRTNPQKKIHLDDIAKKVGNYMIIGKGARGPNPDKQNVNTFGVHFVEVEVDLATGSVEILNDVAVHEFGRVINPLTLSSQVEGGVIQGMGFGLYEGRIMDRRTGKMVNANLTDYKLPTAMEIPVIDSEPVDQVDTIATSIGAKGAGEPPIIPQAAAIANAVYHATGLRIRELPITPDKILSALKSRSQ